MAEVSERAVARKQKAGSGGRGDVPLHRVIYEQMLHEVENGTYGVGDRLPSEALLCERFGASRITVAKAIGTLQREGLVRRRAGSGTFVTRPAENVSASMRFGLLIPDLGMTEIFEPICRGMMSSPLARPHSLTWGHSAADGEVPEVVAEDLCRQFIAQKMTGVFFAPLEFAPDRYAANHRIANALEKAKIAVVLLDRGLERFPGRSRFDLVGIDNHRAGGVVTGHLLDAGAKRPVFVNRCGAGPTVHERAAGYWTVMRDAGLAYAGAVCQGEAEDPDFLQGVLDREKPDALVCANDRTAASVMLVLLSRGVKVPGEVRVTGVDDVKYAKFLPVALTTIHQNCAEMGRAAMETMLNRLENPGRPGREVLTDFQLVVRESCGAGLK